MRPRQVRKRASHQAKLVVRGGDDRNASDHLGESRVEAELFGDSAAHLRYAHLDQHLLALLDGDIVDDLVLGSGEALRQILRAARLLDVVHAPREHDIVVERLGSHLRFGKLARDLLVEVADIRSDHDLHCRDLTPLCVEKDRIGLSDLQ